MQVLLSPLRPALSSVRLQELSMEIDLCDMLLKMRLRESESAGANINAPLQPSDSNMLDAQMYNCNDAPAHPNVAESSPYQGCAYLQHMQSRLETFPTTGGEYIESIFTHRQIFFAFPGGHRSCARAYSDLACYLQHRERRADREADQEAATAFNYEAEFIASVVS
ncbi:hypothetical protein FB45DRAFT_207559 [Roridomyces roridus]|uniref:Uncharacterized protein n=1 Tax=Roridomyces roridus TaxID=1738132 RepID=A0AAD7CG88_9AGAR|nr:hypothetical protein FB45DRAFT_207559 [Roridomyces roridus]